MLGYFGPVGTFTHQALLSLDRGDGEPFATVPDTIAAVADGRIEAGLVPIENSVEGGVSTTLDTLAATPGVRIVNEVLLPVEFGLYVRPGTELGQVRSVLTHPHAAAQCREWVRSHLPLASLVEGGSTAAAAREVASADSSHDAAICAQVAGELYGLSCAALGIADNEAAVTRFVLVAGPAHPATTATGADRTTVVAYMHDNHPGALLEILEQFAARGVNLSRIESRPTKTTLGSYCFSIDADGHLTDARMAETLKGLRRVCKDVIFLGSYPRADRVPTQVGPGSSNDDHAAAEEWFGELR